MHSLAMKASALNCLLLHVYFACGIPKYQLLVHGLKFVMHSQSSKVIDDGIKVDDNKLGWDSYLRQTTIK